MRQQYAREASSTSIDNIQRHQHRKSACSYFPTTSDGACITLLTLALPEIFANWHVGNYWQRDIAHSSFGRRTLSSHARCVRLEHTSLVRRVVGRCSCRTDWISRIDTIVAFIRAPSGVTRNYNLSCRRWRQSVQLTVGLLWCSVGVRGCRVWKYAERLNRTTRRKSTSVVLLKSSGA